MCSVTRPFITHCIDISHYGIVAKHARDQVFYFFNNFAQTMNGLLLELHGLTLAACSYALLVEERVAMLTQPSQGCWRSLLVYK